MRILQLPGGTIDYEDTGGDGPVVVLLHGLLMDSSLWDAVVTDLSADHRCIAPTLPLGAHRRPIDAEDLSLRTVTELVRQFMLQLRLDAPTVVGNDTGGAVVQLLAVDNSANIGRIALVSCDAFDNFPPGLTGKALVLAGKLPAPLFGLFMQQMRLKAVRRLPIAFGWLTKRGDHQTVCWLRPLLTQRKIRRETVRVLRSVAAERDLLAKAAGPLASFDRPALVVWATEDRVMPPDHGRRLTDLLPHSRLEEIAESYTLIPLDQPTKLASAIRRFIRETPSVQAGPLAHPNHNAHPFGARTV